jgi:hypothetical protein
MRAARVAVSGAATALLVASLIAPAPASTASHGQRRPASFTRKHGPRVIRDVQAGVHDLNVAAPEQSDTTIEPSIAVNPENPKNVVTCYQEGRVDAGGDQVNGCATTFNGGKTWTDAHLPGLTPDVEHGTYDRASDAVVAFGPNNVVYANSLVFDDTSGNGLRSAIVVNVSKDGGKTWGPMIEVEGDQGGGLNDKNWIIVDNSDATGHHLGRVYVVWDRVAPVIASYSDDEGATWTPPSVIYSGQGIGTLPLVLPSGDLGIVFTTIAGGPAVRPPEGEGQETAGKLVYSVAAGAGTVPFPGALAFSAPVTIDNDLSNGVRGQRASDGLPTADVDPTTGRIYVAWDDGRFRADTPKATNENDIVYSYSDDGVQWTPAARVNRPAKASKLSKNAIDHFNPMIGVGKDGTVHIAYLQRKEGPGDVSTFSPFVDTYYQELKKDKTKWSKPLRVNRFRSDTRFAAFSRNGAFFGDYNQVAVTGSWTYIVRCEGHRETGNEIAAFPPKVHHQRTWVALVDSDGNGKP